GLANHESQITNHVIGGKSATRQSSSHQARASPHAVGGSAAPQRIPARAAHLDEARRSDGVGAGRQQGSQAGVPAGAGPSAGLRCGDHRGRGPIQPRPHDRRGRTAAGVQVIGLTAGPRREVVTTRVLGFVSELVELVDLRWRPHPDDLIVYDDYVGERYGVPTTECLDAIRIVARTEGVLLDPVYTGKAMAGLMGLIAQERFTSGQNVVFWHTGGQPAVFAHAGAFQEG